MADPRINATFTATDKVTPTVKAMRGEITRLGSKTGGPLGGLLGGIGGLNLGMVGLGVGVVGAVSALGDFAKQAIDDQQSVERMTTALKANVPSWSGATDAIDAFIQKGQDLAFTDDDIRNSISQLVTRTHDVTKAITLTRQAMDLARLKGMSLADASGILGKVFSGQVASARRAGIAIDKTADSTEALAQIQKAAAGQADTYAKTQGGKLESLGIKWSEFTESVGYGVLELVNGIGSVADAVGGLNDILKGHVRVGKEMEAALRKEAAAQGLDADAAIAFYEAQLNAVEIQKQNARAMLDSAIIAEHLANPTESLADLMTKFGDTTGEVTYAINVLGESWYNANKVVDDSIGYTQAADGVLNQYTKSLRDSTDAANSSADAYHHRNDYLTDGTVLVGQAADAQTIFNNILGSGSQTATDQVVRNYDEVRRAMSGDMKKARDESVKYLGQIPVFAARKFAGGLPLIQSAIAAYELAITEPVKKAKQIAAINAELTSRKIRNGLKSHNPQIRQDTQTLVDWLIAKRNELNGTVIFTGRVVAGATGYIGPGGQGQSGGPEIAPRSGGGGGGGGNHPSAPGTQHIHLWLDGKEVAHVVNREMGRQYQIAGRSHSRA